MADMLRSGQFARLCRTTKDTLRHYEEIGLLAPASTAPNGYKQYAPSQVVDFMLISSLRDAGCGLADIGRFLRGGKGTLRGALVERVEALGVQAAELERRRDLLARAVARMDELASWAPAGGEPEDGSWRVRDCAEAFYVETRVPLDAGVEGAFGALADHAAYCEGIGLGMLARFQQTSYRIEGACFASGDYGAGFFLTTQTKRPVECGRLHVRRAGGCLQHLRALPLAAMEGGDEGENPVFDAFDEMRGIAGREGLAIAGDAYSAELTMGSIGGGDCLWVETSALVE